MKHSFLLISWMTGLFAAGCQSQAKAPVAAPAEKKIEEIAAPLKPYERLSHTTTELVSAEPGTKSVLFDLQRKRLYAMNLEGMSIAEYDRATRRPVRYFRFEKTQGRGWDYTNKRSIPSWEEKPVEAWLTHQDRVLWVSLHNASGIVGIRVDSLDKNIGNTEKAKRIAVSDSTGQVTNITVPLFITGATPKIIIATPDEKKLLVSNWHAKSIRVLDLLPTSPYARLSTSIRMPEIPRGMVSDPIRKKTYVAIMGGYSLAVLDEQEWKTDTILPIGGSPRHILRDSSGRLLVSYNAQARLACLNPDNGKTLFSISTAAQPRTIALSRNQQFVFVTGYSSDRLEVYKIFSDRFEQVASLSCPGHPVGVDLFENDDRIEAWVCSYQGGNIRVFNFQKN